MPIQVQSAKSEKAWGKYQEIESVIYQRYGKNEKIEDAVMSALQRLQEAVLRRYALNPESYLSSKKFTLQLKDPEEMDLSSEEKMVNARFAVWQEGISAGYGGYVEQLSLQETLDKPFSEIKLIVNITQEHVNLLYSQIQLNIAKELGRLREKGSTDKIKAIEEAMQYLEAAVHYKYRVASQSAVVLSDEQKRYVDSIDLYSLDTLRNAKVGRWSVNGALNLSTDNWISWYFGLQESWWGQANALKNFETNLTRVHDKS